MDSSESGFISKHRTELINLTTCDVILLETLGTKNILSKCERQVINACSIDLEKSAKFYDIIVTKTGAFQCLMSALEETKQSGAHSIIAQYYNEIHNILTFKLDEHDPQESEHRRFLEGWYGPRPVFIKRERRETKTAKEQLSKLVKILTLVDSHINIVRYFTSEFKCESGPVNFVFEQCDMNLQSVLESSQEPETVQTPIKLNKISVLQQIARGLSYIKSLGILHLNLRPTNILLTNLVSSGVVVKVSNFSHARQLSYQSDKTLSCPVSHKTVEKNREWLPREILLDYQQFKAKKLKNISGVIDLNKKLFICNLTTYLTNNSF